MSKPITSQAEVQKVSLFQSGQSDGNENVPHGLDPLVTTSNILVKYFEGQHDEFDTRHKFAIYNQEGVKIYTTGQISRACCCICCCGPYTTLLVNEKGRTVLKLLRNKDRIDVCNQSDRLIGSVSMYRDSTDRANFIIQNNHGDPSLMLAGPSNMALEGSVRFDLKQAESLGESLGVISGRLPRNGDTSPGDDTFSIPVPVGLDARLKALIIANIILVESMYSSTLNELSWAQFCCS